MTKEIIFHLGDYKTGSTSIQRILAAQDFTIPGRRVLFTARENHMDLPRSLYPENRLFARQKEIWETHAQAIRTSDADIAVISAENMNHLDPAQMRAAVDRYFPDFSGRIRYVTYLRPHADRIVSSFAERRKLGEFFGGMAKLHTEILDKQRLFYTPRFTAWKAQFGPAFHIRPMVREHLFRGDVVHDFFRFMCGSEEFEIHGDTHRNESLSVAELLAVSELQREIKRLGGKKIASRDVRHRIAGLLQEALAVLPRKADLEKPRLHKALAARIQDSYREDAAAMDAAFFEGSPFADALAGAKDKALDAPQSLRLGDYYNDDALRMFLAIAAMLGATVNGQDTLAENQIADRLEKIRPQADPSQSGD